MICTDIVKLSIPSQPVKDVREGGVVARQLSAALERHNKKVLKKYRKSMGKADSPTIGIGLSAPQIGVYKQVAVITAGNIPIVLMNPQIVDSSSTLIPYLEGCLSFPGVEIYTERHLWIKVKCLNHPDILTFGPSEGFSLNSFSATILASVVAQHEISHLFGKTFYDFVRKPEAVS